MDPQRNRSISAARTASGAAVNTLKGPDGELSCTPAIVDFEDVRNGLLYVMAVSVRNQSKTSRRIRLALDQPSITAGFTLTFDPPAATAPGLDVRAEVDFQVPEGTPDSQGEFRGTLAVTSGAARLAVPLLARRPAPDLRVPPLADFGPCVREGGAAACALELRNAGTAPAKWKVEIPESVAGVLTISPSEGVLPPARMHLDLDGDGDVEMANEVVTNEAGCRQELHLTLEPRELALGPVRALVRVAVEGQPARTLDVAAQVVEQQLQLVAADGSRALDRVDFGPLLLGQVREVRALLVNGGPQPTSYASALEPDPVALADLEQQERDREQQAAAAAAAAGGGDAASRRSSSGGAGGNQEAEEEEEEAAAAAAGGALPVSVAPAEGVLGPYARLPVTLTFAPPPRAAGKGFRAAADARGPRRPRWFAATLLIEAADIKQTVPVKLQGRAVAPALQVSQDVMRFGECPANDRRDLLVTLANPTAVPLAWELGRAAHFAARPRRGRLAPGARASVVFSFVPAQLGAFKARLELTVDRGAQVVPLYLQGTAGSVGPREKKVGGPDKGPADFEPKFKFVKAEVAAAQAPGAKRAAPKPKWVRPKAWEKLNPQDLLTSVSWDDETHAAPNNEDRNEGRLTYSLQEIARRAEHKEGYSDWLRRAREDRTAKAQLSGLKAQAKRAATRTGARPVFRDPRLEDERDLGMERGLEAPEPPLPPPEEKLWLASEAAAEGAGGGGGGGGGGGAGGAADRKKRAVDEDKLVAKKFKPKPTTQAEVRDCESELSSQELLAVYPSTRVLDFGKVNVSSTVAKNFVITNELPKSVVVALGKMSGEISQSTPMSQVIPANNIAGFDIIFKCDNEQKYKRVISYTINGRYTFKFTILAQVVPVEIRLSHKELAMSFPPDSLERSVAQALTLTNPGNSPAEYVWSTRGAFSVKPESGALAPYSSAEVQVIWLPTPGARLQEAITVAVPGGKDESVTVTGDLPEARCAFRDKALELGTVAVGIGQSVEATLRNTGQTPAVFFVDPFPPQMGITVEPAKGRIEVGQQQALVVRVQAKTPQAYPGLFLNAAVRGGKLARVPLQVEAIIPEVCLDLAEFNFGQIALGARDRAPFALENRSAIPGSVLLNLEGRREFAVELVADRRAEDDHSQSTLRTKDHGEQYNIMEPFHPHGARSQSRLTPDGEVVDDARQWRIAIGPHSTMRFHMVYRPEEVAAHDFQLPLAMEGVEGDARLARRVRAAGAKPQVLLSTTVLDFEDRVVARDPTQLTPYSAELTIKNDHKRGVSWEVDDAGLREPADPGGQMLSSTPPVFFVSPQRGDLVVKEETTVRVTFTPRTDEYYEFELPIYLGDQEDRSKPYLTLTLKGSGVYPRLAFDRDPVLMPVVPLQVTSRAVFTVLNHGYSSLELTHRLQPGCPVNLEVEFPDGKAVGLANSALRVLVSFKAEKAVAFATKLTLFDADGHTYPLTICGSADNCLLTNYPFVAARREEFDFYTKENAGVRFLSKTQIRAIEAKEMRMKEKLKKEKAREKAKLAGESRPASPDGKNPSVYETLARSVSQMSLKEGGEGQLLADNVAEAEAMAGYEMDEAALDFLAKWLSFNVSPTPFQRFPEDIIEGSGKLALDMIEAMSSRRVPGRLKALPPQRKQQWSALLGQYTELLVFLKEKGALLATVRPEALLGQEDYVRAAEHQAVEQALQNGLPRPSPAQLKAQRQAGLAGHARAAGEAWAQVLLQSVRVFMLSRVTPKHFHAQPAVLMPARHKAKDGKVLPDGELLGSNVYGVPEGLLLRWVAYHTNNTLPAAAFPRRFADFEGDLRDLAALCHVLLSHVPSLVPPGHRDDLAGGGLGGGGGGADDHSHASGATAGAAAAAAALRARGLMGAPLEGFHGMAAADELAEDEGLREENRAALVGALAYLHQDFGLTADDLAEMDGRCYLLLVLHLYLNLPQLVPKTTIEFPSTLGVESYKSIELRNPNRRAAIEYEVQLEGATSFSVQDQRVAIPPGAVAQFPVKVLPKFSHPPEEGRLTFWNKQIGTSWPRPSSLVFMLKSTVKDVMPVNTIESSCACYESSTTEVEVKNPYDQDVFLTLTIKQELKEPFEFTEHFTAAPGGAKPVAGGMVGPGGKRKGRNSEVASSASKARSLAETPDERALMGELMELMRAPFYVSGPTTLKLDAGGVGKVRLMCCPITPGTYTCDLVFLEEVRGEFAYRVQMAVGLPQTMESLSFSVLNDEQDGGSGPVAVPRELKVPSRSPGLDRALQLLTDRFPGAAPKTKVKQALQAMLHKETVEQRQPMAVMLDSPFFAGPDRIHLMTDWDLPKGQRKHALLNLKKATVGAPQASDTDANSFLMTFTPKAAGTYPAKVLFRSLGLVPDLRVYALKATMSVAPTTTRLEFQLPARQSTVQEIPLVNSGDADWSLACTLAGSKCFSGPTSLAVPAGQTRAYPLKFSPTWICRETATLTIRNTATGDAFEYQLEGEGEEPLAEGHTAIACKAREKVKHVFEVRNYSPAAQTFEVESDMLNVQGPSRVAIGARAVAPYELEISPQSGGTYTGSLTFKAPSGEYMWYTMELTVSAPAEEDTIELRTVVRQAVSVEITLSNPLDEELQFDVLIRGEGLLGDPLFALAPRETGAYTLFYSPLVAQEHAGSVAFINARAGEFWYRLQLAAEAPPAVRVPELACMVGGSARATVTVENPLGEDVVLVAEVSNRRNFGVDPPRVALPPYGRAEVGFSYAPSSLTEVETGRAVLRHRRLGAWVYELRGRGELPGVMPEQAVTATVGEPQSHVFTFRNPFGEALAADMVMRSGDGGTGAIGGGRLAPSPRPGSGPHRGSALGRRSKDISASGEDDEDFPFELLVKKLNSIVLGPYAPLQIPISFSPTSISEKNATIEIRGVYRRQNLCWVFPIRGIAEAPTQLRAFSLVAQAKSSTRKDVEVRLRGLADLTAPESFQHELVFLGKDEKERALAQRSVSVAPVQSALARAGDALKYQLAFDPLKPFHSAMHLVVIRRGGGRWRFEITLEATQPEPDDRITVEAAINTTANVVFRLTNRFLSYAPFQAYFSTDSAYTLSVAPTSGVLAPYGSEGSQFAVAFSPIEYGKPQKGRLFIETDEMVWSYEVVGTTPSYVLNKGNIQPKISNKLDPHVASQLGKSKSSKRGFTKSFTSKPSQRSQF